MTRPTLYSSSRAKAAGIAAPPPVPEKNKNQWRAWLRQNRLPMLAAVPGLAALVFVLLQTALAPPQVITTQEDIDAAVTKALETVPVPSHSTRSYEAVSGSIVRVRSFHDGPDGGEIEGSVGTGVVILSQYDDPDYAISLLSEGAAGYAYLLKDRIAEGDQLAHVRGLDFRVGGYDVGRGGHQRHRCELVNVLFRERRGRAHQQCVPVRARLRDVVRADPRRLPEDCTRQHRIGHDDGPRTDFEAACVSQVDHGILELHRLEAVTAENRAGHDPHIFRN